MVAVVIAILHNRRGTRGRSR